MALLADPRRKTEVDAAVEREIDRRRRERERRERSGQLDELRDLDKTLPGFVKNHWATLEPEQPLAWGWALDATAEHLTACADGEILRLLMNVPPGFMKSLMTGAFFPSWLWGPMARPGLRFLGASFKEDHAKRDTKRMLDLVTSDRYADLYGDHVQVIGKGATDKFTNSRTGWRMGRPIASLTGDRGDFVLVDDPHSVEGAESDADRKKTLRVMRETIPTRLNSPERSVIIVIMQRIHEDDVSGMILAEKLGYTHLMLPMRFEPDRRCTTSIGFTDPRTYEGELLFPEHFTAAAVDRTEKEMTEYAVAGQMQQRPTNREGGLFKKTWFEVVNVIPMGGVEVRAWDLAGSKKTRKSTDPDWTVGLKGKRLDSGDFIITDMIRMRDTPGKVATAIKNAATQDGYGCQISLAQDPGQAGKFQIEFLISLLAGYTVHSDPVSGDKTIRASGAATQAEFGKIKMVKAEWNAEFIAEVGTFPAARHDDIVDALSDLIRVLSSAPFNTYANVG